MKAEDWRAFLESPALRDVLRTYEQGWQQMLARLAGVVPPGADGLRLVWVDRAGNPVSIPTSGSPQRDARDAALIAAWRSGVRPGKTIPWRKFSEDIMQACGVAAVAGKPPNGFGIRGLQKRLDMLRKRGLI